MSTAVVQASTEVLNSWKEIARYLDRGVRTVQRWEAELNLPVRRPHAKGRSVVIALRSEIDLWLKACPLEKKKANAADAEPVTQGRQMRMLNVELLLEGQRLRKDIAASRLQASVALVNLVATLERMTGESSNNSPAKLWSSDTDGEPVMA